MPATTEILRELDRLNRESNWGLLSDRAIAVAADHDDDATVAAFAAHALRQLGAIEEGYAWAQRAVAIDPRNLFAQNRLSLLANLSGNPEAAYRAGELIAARLTEPEVVFLDHDTLNLAITIVNAIHAAAKLGRIPDAVALFTPAIERLDHVELHFNSACLYALAGDDRVFRYIRRALITGKKKVAFDDPDFAALRSDPRYRELLARDWLAEHAALARAKHERGQISAREFLDYGYGDGDGDAEAARQRIAAVNAEAVRDADAEARAALRPDHFLDPEELRVASYSSIDRTRSLEVEAAIAAAVDDPDGYLIYADWLLERENPRGQLILASHRCVEAKSESERMLAFVAWAAFVHHHARRWLGTAVDLLAQASRTRWFMGFVTELVFDTGYARRPGDTAAELLASTLELPVCRLLRHLEVREVFENGYTEVLAIVAACRLDLRGLAIGTTGYQLSLTMLDARGLLSKFPRLEHLELAAHQITIDPIDGEALPHLRRLVLRTPTLSPAVLAPILETRWTQLEELELWFGASDVDHAALAQLLSGHSAPMLARLRLKGARFVDALCESLVSAKILPQLIELDISMAALTDEGARTLLANVPRLRHLVTVTISGDALSAGISAELRRALPNIVLATPLPEDAGAYDDDADE